MSMDEWDEKFPKEKPDFFEGIMYNIFEFFQATAFWWLLVIGVVVFVGGCKVLDKVFEFHYVEGHKYVRISMYSSEHSQTCWCREKK